MKRGKNVPIETRGGKRLDVVSLLGSLGQGEVGDWDVILRDRKVKYDLRLIAIKRSKSATEKERKKILQESKYKGWKLDPRTLKSAEYILLITDMPRETLSAFQVLELYRFRWQIELVFKRLKSILQINNIRAKDPLLARTYIFSKIIGALIIEELTGKALSFFPWGFRLPSEAFELLENNCHDVWISYNHH